MSVYVYIEWPGVSMYTANFLSLIKLSYFGTNLFFWSPNRYTGELYIEGYVQFIEPCTLGLF